MSLEIDEVWKQAKTVFDLGTLELSGDELKRARQQARPFVELVSREFRGALSDQLLFEEELADRVVLQVRGWSGKMLLKYSGRVTGKETKPRHRFDHFEMDLPTRPMGSQVRFSLGVGLKSEETWDTIEWCLGRWAKRSRVEEEAMPMLQRIHEHVPDLQLDSWQNIIALPGTFACIGRLVKYTEFGEDVAQSVRTVVSDLRRLLDAAQLYQ